MSMTDEVKFDADPKPPKKAKAKKKAAAKPAAKPSQFEGMTRTACADGCNAKACIVSGKPYCAHPTKGGLQPADQNNLPALKRLQDARDFLRVRIDPDRFKD